MPLLEIGLSGAAPVFEAGGAASGARALTVGATPYVAYRVRSTDGTVLKEAQQELAGPSLRIESVPLGRPITIEIRTLAADRSTVVSSWTSPVVKLDGSPLQLEAILEPASTNQVVSATLPVIEPGSFGARSTTFFTITSSFGPGEVQAGELVHVSTDTGGAFWPWLKVYGSDWKTLESGYHGPDSGSAVFPWPADGRVHVAVANVLSWPGHPLADLSCYLTVHKARVYAPGATGNGLSLASPAALPTTINASYHNTSLILSGGTYHLGGLAMQINDVSAVNVRIMGGFSSDYRQRNQETIITTDRTASASDIATMNFNSAGSGLLDGLEIRSNRPAAGYRGVALNLQSNYKVIVNNCILKGFSQDIPLAGSVMSAGLLIQYGPSAGHEIASCTVSGGTPINSVYPGQDMETIGIRLEQTAKAYIHHCAIDGGTAVTGTASNTLAYGVYLGQSAGSPFAILSQNRIWGGRAEGNLVSGSLVKSIGVHSATGVPRLVATSNIVSGGLARGYDAQSRALVLASNAGNLVLGNTLDTGIADGPDPGSVSAASVSGNYGAHNGCLESNLLLPSSVAGGVVDRVVGIDMEGAGFVASLAGNACIGLDAVRFNNVQHVTFATVPDNIPGVFVSGNAPMTAGAVRTVSQEMNGHSAVGTYAGFLQNGYLPVSGALLAGSQSYRGPANWSGFDVLLSTYPALGLDYNDKRRASGGWARGAYEP